MSRGFFAVDVNQFEKIRNSELGIEEAATYLTLLAGSDQSNTLSTWGIQGIRKCTGFTRAEALRAVDQLAQYRMIEILKVENKNARKVPRYRLPIYETRKPLVGREKAVFDLIKSAQQPSSRNEKQAAHRAKKKGWVEVENSAWKIVEHANEVAFIPNSFVSVEDRNSPLRRLVNNGELDPLMLAVEIYQYQNLLEDRGVPVDLALRYWHCDDVKYLGKHNLHQLELGRTYIDPETGSEDGFSGAQNRSWQTPGFWRNLKALEKLHIVEWAVYSANGKPTSGDEYAFNRPQRPLGVLRNGKHVSKTPEAVPAILSYLSSLIYSGEIEPGGMIDLNDIVISWLGDSPIVAVENSSVDHVEGVGILRMVHRADTENCKAWYKELCGECDEAVFFIEQAIQSQFPQISDITTVIRSSLNS